MTVIVARSFHYNAKLYSLISKKQYRFFSFSVLYGFRSSGEVWGSKYRICSDSANFCNMRLFSSAVENDIGRKEVLIESFDDCNNWLKRIILRIHPDVLGKHSSEVINTNSAHIPELFHLMETLKKRYDLPTESARNVGPQGAFKPSYKLQFYFEDRDNNDKLRLANLDLTVPDVLEEEYYDWSVIDSSKKEIIRSMWLLLSVSYFQQLADAIGVHVSFILSESHLRNVNEFEKMKKQKNLENAANEKDEDYIGDVDFSIADNLGAFSPQYQGKGMAFPKRGLSAQTVFSEKDRTATVDKIFGRVDFLYFIGSALELPSEDRWDFVFWLKDVFVKHHDTLQLFSPVWGIIKIIVHDDPDYADSWDSLRDLGQISSGNESQHDINSFDEIDKKYEQLSKDLIPSNSSSDSGHSRRSHLPAIIRGNSVGDGYVFDGETFCVFIPAYLDEEEFIDLMEEVVPHLHSRLRMLALGDHAAAIIEEDGQTIKQNYDTARQEALRKKKQFRSVMY